MTGKGLSIANALNFAYEQIKPCSSTARFDSELLLADTLQCDRSHFIAWPEQILSTTQWQHYQQLITRAAAGEPIAYIRGHQAFWGLEFSVNTHCLIPRPETELIVETALALYPTKYLNIADLGTGSGAIAIALAHEKPQAHIIATDCSLACLQLAQHNATSLHSPQVNFIQTNWAEALTANYFDLIVSNPPYIADNDPHLSTQVKKFEPQLALFAAEQGLAAYQTLIPQAYLCLRANGYLILEHGFAQANAITALLAQQGFSDITTQRDLNGHERITYAKKSV